jgi:hypothetical protein
MTRIPALNIHVGDSVHFNDWLLHATGSGTDRTGVYVTVTEFGELHLHLGALLDVDRVVAR